MTSTRIITLFATLLGLTLASTAQAELRSYQLDPVHSRVVFSIDHIGLSKAIGSFAKPEGQLRFDPTDWTRAELQVDLGLASLDLGDEDWNQRMLKRDFFHAEKHPQARFVSTRIEPLDGENFLIHGQLTLRGESTGASMTVRFNGERRHPMTRRHTAGFSASMQLSRAALGMKAYPNVIGDAVEVTIEIEAKRERP
jgi:polyisoprenoid-binding protein YceI